MTNYLHVFDAIEKFAAAYSKINAVQCSCHAIPKGDQKTGCIGEFYAYLLLRMRHPDAEIFLADIARKAGI